MNQSIGIALLLLLCVVAVPAQDKPDIEKEKAAIKQAALDYAEGYYEGNGERMERAVHPLLFKRGLVKAGCNWGDADPDHPHGSRCHPERPTSA